jgi:hypothetical protein
MVSHPSLLFKTESDIFRFSRGFCVFRQHRELTGSDAPSTAIHEENKQSDISCQKIHRRLMNKREIYVENLTGNSDNFHP